MEWADILKTIITAVSSVVVALVTAGYFRKNSEKNKSIIKTRLQIDNFHCVKCHKNNCIFHVHHIKPFATIFREFLKSEFNLRRV